MVMKKTSYMIDWHDRAVERSELATDYVRKLVHIDTNAGFTFYDPAAHTAGTLALGRVGGRVPGGRELRILDFLRPHFFNYFKLFDREAAYPRNAYSAAELADACRLLTRREAEVASLLCRRLRPNEIATVLLISPRTVERHIENIYFKLNVRNRKELIRLLLRDRHNADPHLRER